MTVKEASLRNKKTPPHTEIGVFLLIRQHSPYLSANLEAENGFALPSSKRDAEKDFEKIIAAAEKKFPCASDDEIMATLRKTKRKVATLLALTDLALIWSDEEVMQHLSRFADFCIRHALAHLLQTARKNKKISLKNPEDCGVAVIALGKWGADELNYSSDIDLMVVFDPQKSPVKNQDDTQNFFVRLTRDLGRLIEQQTEDGYVFRVDLRLRPDPGSMPLAVSLPTAETYYGSLGQNWERAAMIKARFVAGDIAVGRDFKTLMNIWIWRKSLDFAAIQDIHSIKRQINARQKNAGDSFLGFNVKLGHGGIREIELFVQTQQLIFGGKEPHLRVPQTLAALSALSETGHITQKTQKELADAYLFLRRVEHRLQMQEDHQTHSLPPTAVALEKFSAFMEYSSMKSFLNDLRQKTDAVKKSYAILFTESPSLANAGNLVFTGVEDDPETLKTLQKMGFEETEKVTSTVRGWHHGRYRAVRSEKARQILTELIPHLLQSFCKTPHPDDAFIRFDQFLSRLPSGIPIFSMFAKNLELMTLVADVMGTSSTMADYLGTHPEVLEGALSRDFFGKLPDQKYLHAELSRQLSTARDYEDVLDIVRRFAREKRFHACIHILKKLSPDFRCGIYLSDIAEVTMTSLIPHVQKDFARQHGIFKSGSFALLSLGSLAAKEMSVDSDIDLIGIYHISGNEKTSDGKKSLPPNLYYIRFMQRLLTAITAPTTEGILYKADTRLRPSGEDGSLAVSLNGFEDYYKNKAWTWEHMTLIRSRIIDAPPSLKRKIEDARQSILSMKRDEKKLKKDILSMREKIEKQFGSKDPWNMKYRRGGSMDILFAAQFLMLKHAATHKNILHPNMREGLTTLYRKKLLSKKDFTTFTKAYETGFATQNFLRLTVALPFDASGAPENLKSALVLHVAGKKKGFKDFKKQMDARCAACFKLYKNTIF